MMYLREILHFAIFCHTKSDICSPFITILYVNFQYLSGVKFMTKILIFHCYIDKNN